MTEPHVDVISQRRLRNDSGEILRRAAAGETFRLHSGSVAVDLHAAQLTEVEQLTAAGCLTSGTADDFLDFTQPVEGQEPLDKTMDAIRSDR